MTRRQSILDYIVAYSFEHGYSPTVREIGQAVGLASSSSVWGELRALADDGRITYEPRKARTIRVVL